MGPGSIAQFPTVQGRANYRIWVQSNFEFTFERLNSFDFTRFLILSKIRNAKKWISLKLKDLKSEMRIQTDFDHIVEQKGVQITLCIVVSDFFAKENLTHVDLWIFPYPWNFGPLRWPTHGSLFIKKTWEEEKYLGTFLPIRCNTLCASA